MDEEMRTILAGQNDVPPLDPTNTVDVYLSLSSDDAHNRLNLDFASSVGVYSVTNVPPAELVKLAEWILAYAKEAVTREAEEAL